MSLIDRKQKSAGRRRNYQPAVVETPLRRHLPRGWSNWVGFVLFGLISIALVAEVISSIGRHNSDPIAALILLGLMSWMTYLFGTNRFSDT